MFILPVVKQAQQMIMPMRGSLEQHRIWLWWRCRCADLGENDAEYL